MDFIFPPPALPGSGSMGIISVRLRQTPLIDGVNVTQKFLFKFSVVHQLGNWKHSHPEFIEWLRLPAPCFDKLSMTAYAQIDDY